MAEVGEAPIAPKTEYPHIPTEFSLNGLENDQTETSEQIKTAPEAAVAAPVEPLYSVLTFRQKQTMVMIVSFVAIISPLSGNIYYPAIPALSKEFHVSATLIQLTITVYQIFQGIAPTFIANFSDTHGRRPAYAICAVIYLGANIGLALQTSYPALMVLRCLQSTGSASTVALASGAVADMVTRAERGRFISYASLGVSLGPVLAPIIGGLLTEYLGWRANFWFLVIIAVLLFAIYFLFVPETARSVVGNGSIAPKRCFMTPSQYLKHKRKQDPNSEADRATLKVARKPVNPLNALKIIGEREGGITLGFGALIYGGYFMVLTTLPTLLTERFGFNALQTGLCYIPIFVGTLASRWIAGRLLDWNYRRHARLVGVEITKDRQQDLDMLPIEAARLQVCIPMIYITALCIVAYGWTMESRASLAGIEVTLFFLGIFNAGGLAGLSTLVVDTHQESPATATAANNLFRYLLSAGATAAAVPLIDRIGIGWTSVLIAGLFVFFSPSLWLVLLYGAKWRQEKIKSEKAKEDRKLEGSSSKT
ncbi:unnamed protein product [Discula destructiva]